MKTPLRRFTVMAVVGAALATGALAVNPLLKELESAFVEIGEAVRPWVVQVEVEGDGGGETRSPGMNQDIEDLLRQFGVPIPQEMPRRVASASGFIYDTQGHIITNNHVVGGAGKVKVRLNTGEEHEARVIGTDMDTDLAVVKIDVDYPLPVAHLGDSDALRVGQFSIAVGSPRGLENSLSFGHITALGRESLPLPQLRFQGFIQTDAAINLGNSGGPLCNIDGEVVGVNTAIVSGADSLGFAIPVNRVKEIVPRLIAEGKITRGFLGVQISDIAQAAEWAGLPNVEDFCTSLKLPDAQGVYVRDVTSGYAAERAGLTMDDVIRRIDGVPVEGSADLVQRISAMAPGTEVALDIWREGEPQSIKVKLDEYPGELRKARLGRDILGMRVQDVAPETLKRLGQEESATGVVVMSVEPDSPAAKAEIAHGDIIVKVAFQEVAGTKEFRRLMAEHSRPGRHVVLRVIKPDGESLLRTIQVPEDYVAP